jgi:hypothetical protein
LAGCPSFLQQAAALSTAVIPSTSRRAFNSRRANIKPSFFGKHLLLSGGLR